MLKKLAFPICLIFLGAVSTIYFSYRLAGALWLHSSLTRQADAQISRWEIREVQGKFAIWAIYCFEYEASSQAGVAPLPGLYYLNEPSAIEELRKQANQKWTVWFDPLNPSHSFFEKSFPSALLIRTLICYGVFIWFVIWSRKIVLQ